MKYYYIEPEVAGSFGEQTILDSSLHPPKVTNLHYFLEGWLGDVLLELFPCWIVTTSAMNEIRSNRLSGVTFSDVKVTVSDELSERQPELKIPQFIWMKVHGTQGRDDFGIGKGFKKINGVQRFDPHQFILVISQKALDLLQRLGISHATIEDFP